MYRPNNMDNISSKHVGNYLTKICEFICFQCWVIDIFIILTEIICQAVIFRLIEMEVSTENIRFLVESCRRNSLSATDAYHFVCKGWGENATSLRTVYRLYNQFASGKRISLEDSERSGRPRSSAHDETVDIVRELLDDDPHATIEILMECTNSSYGMIQRILTEELKLKWITAKWVPHFLSDKQKLNRVVEAN